MEDSYTTILETTADGILVNKTITIMNLDGYVSRYGEGQFNSIAQEYHCTKDKELEEFLRSRALHNSRHSISKTFLALDDRMNLQGFVTIAIKCVKIKKPEHGSEISR